MMWLSDLFPHDCICSFAINCSIGIKGRRAQHIFANLEIYIYTLHCNIGSNGKIEQILRISIASCECCVYINL